MAAVAYLTYQNGKIEVPEELQREWQLHDGSRLQVVAQAQPSSRIASELSKSVKDIDWRVFEGCLQGNDVDMNAELEQERIREHESTARS